jgi:uncharacterized protein
VRLALEWQGEPVQIDIETAYPWDGQVTLTVNTRSSASPWSLALRVPEWCAQATLSLNGNNITPQLDENGYLTLTRSWQPGDVVQLDLRMQPTFIAPHPRIDALRGCVALQRGPLIYCFESQDQPGDVDLLDVQVLTDAPMLVTNAPILGGIQTIHVPAQGIAADWAGALYRPLTERPSLAMRAVQLTAVPYFVWGNRGMQSMRVWVPQEI